MGTRQACCPTRTCWLQGEQIVVTMLRRARNCTTRRTRPGRPQAASTPRVISTRRRRCPMAKWAWCWWREGIALVLVAGGIDVMGHALASAELYDRVSGTWTVTGSLNTGRYRHTATLLSNGMVLVAGGVDSSINASASAELYDATSGTWTATGGLNTARDRKSVA